MKRLIYCLTALAMSTILCSYAMTRNFAENVDVLAMELSGYTLIEDPLDLIEKDSELAWLYMQTSTEISREEEAIPVSNSYEKQGYEKFHAVNPETVGYINIENSKVDYPILCSSDNNYYLDYNVYNKKDSNGAIYLDAYSNGVWGRINLVHGHSMRNGTMFRDLLNYVNQSWYEQHKTIRVFDGVRDKVYEVFSVYILDATKEAVPIYYDDEDAFQEWLSGVIDRSLVSGGSLKDDKDLLILNTCSYQFSGAHTIVVASRVS